DSFPQTIDDAIAQDGTARIIVSLDMAESSARSGARQSREETIAEVQDEFLDSLSPSSGLDVFGAMSIVEPVNPELKKFTKFPFIRMEVGASLLERIKNNPLAQSVELDHVLSLHLSDSVPLIGADKAWDMGYTGKCQAVAFLDTGVWKHPDLVDKLVAEACFSVSGSNSLCPDELDEKIGPGSATYCPEPGNVCKHGTHTAGIAVANGGVKGVAKEANLVAIQVFHRNGSKLGAYVSDVILGLEHVLKLHNEWPCCGIAAVNMSLGGGKFYEPCDGSYPTLTKAIAALRDVGIATIVSSGNSGYDDAISVPACISHAISVGATWKSDNMASFLSNSAYFLDFLAPGVLINSTIPGGDYAKLNGTSMSAPYVTGAWAVLKSANPTATIDNIFTVLQETGKPIPDIRNGITKPRIQVDAALEELKPILLYGVHDAGLNNSHLFTIDTAGDVTELSVYPGYDIEGLDIHPQSCQLYASAGDDTHYKDTTKPAPNHGHLYLVNKENGKLTDLGSTGSQEVDALSFNPDGKLWGWAQDEGLLRFDDLPSSATATLVIPYDGDIEDITWNSDGTILYGVENVHGGHDPDSHGPLDPDGGVKVLAYDIDTEVITECELYDVKEIEALDTLPDGNLIIGYHGHNKLLIGVLDFESCSITQTEEIPSPYNDVEGIAWYPF
ncbi:MAG: S8 family serine peptidase, partial [Bacteroides sp.]|nr:S8 family serine peptidase [Bacteroides sp.]